MTTSTHRPNGKKLTIATFVALATLALVVGKLIWSASAQSEQIKVNKTAIAECKPEVVANRNQSLQNKERIAVLEVQQKAILDGVQDINRKIDRLGRTNTGNP